jgi:hypothetical protein
MPAQMRTIEGAWMQLKENDPDTALTKHAIRQLVLSGTIKHVKVGCKRLLNYNDLLNYLANPSVEVGERAPEYGRLRQVSP